VITRDFVPPHFVITRDFVPPHFVITRDFVPPHFVITRDFVPRDHKKTAIEAVFCDSGAIIRLLRSLMSSKASLSRFERFSSRSS
jgi:hypothetical protein